MKRHTLVQKTPIRELKIEQREPRGWSQVIRKCKQLLYHK